MSEERNSFQLDVDPFSKSYYPQFQPDYDQGLEYYPQQSAFIRQPVRNPFSIDYSLFSRKYS